MLGLTNVISVIPHFWSWPECPAALLQQQRTFIQMRTLLEVMDNSGAKRLMCLQPLKGKKGARLGDTIIVPWNAIACSPSNYLLQQKPYFAPGFRHVVHIVPLFSMLQRAHPPFASPTLPMILVYGSNNLLQWMRILLNYLW